MLSVLSVSVCAQSFTGPQTAYFELSAYKATGDSTLVWAPDLPAIVHRVIVVIDSAWNGSDSLKIGVTGFNRQRPGDVWSSDSLDRGSNTAISRVYLNTASMFLAARGIYLYHVLTGTKLGKIRVFITYQSIDYGTPAMTVLGTADTVLRRDSNGQFHCTYWSWDDLRESAHGIIPAGAGDAPTTDNTDGSLQFFSDKNSDVAVIFQMPHTWRSGTDIGLHIHWQKTTTDTGFVRWQYSYTWANIDDTFSATSAFTNGYNTTALDGSTKARIFAFADISGAGKTASSILKIVIRRQSNGAPDDTYNNIAKMLSVDIHIQTCLFGAYTPTSGQQ